MDRFLQTKTESSIEKNPTQMGGAMNEKEPTRTPESFFGLMGYLSKLPQLFLISIGAVLVLLVGILSNKVGPQLSLTIFYMIPIAMVTWFSGRSIGFLFSILSALVWLIADLESGTAYLQSDIPYWNGVIRLGSLIILTFILSELKSTLKQE